MIDQMDFAKIVVGLAANFGIKIQDGLIELWYNAFKEDGISIEQIRYAAGRILRKPKDRYGRLPTYDEMIEIIQGGSYKDRALVIANEIIAHTKRHGARVFPKIEDETARYLMTKRWPYHEWAESVLDSDFKWWIKEFCEAYVSYTTIKEISHDQKSIGMIEEYPDNVRNIIHGLVEGNGL